MSHNNDCAYKLLLKGRTLHVLVNWCTMFDAKVINRISQDRKGRVVVGVELVRNVAMHEYVSRLAC